MMTCPACGRHPVHTVEQYQYRESGLTNVFVRGVGIDKCECGQEYVQLPGAQEVHDQIASALLSKSSLLTGPESRFLRKWLRMTSEGMAKALGCTRVTVSRWENNGPVAASDRALRLYAAAVRNMSKDFETLFTMVKAKPEKSFSIVVDGVQPALQHPVDLAPETVVATSMKTLALPRVQEHLFVSVSNTLSQKPINEVLDALADAA